ncbi:lipopolysaccharide transport periplasmic protein LptA [Vibrio hangzhouensis]|uniref:lipopolysaccharide transport periplasmic protein LptA n=1 Tax=Vibrio hangzhouensis TaxID=462991 RepID=UPI001C949E1D|nr:lipopolysaccharide transport periplasmic protein LptA [Vibrio hangzhouensis]MBY6196937.1 lipopolysaccharide transport periplasmic protein LptA [Vibrio hangzhouensis]
MKLSHLSLGLYLLLPLPAMALSTDSEQPIYIDSDTQQLDMKSNRVTFEGDVKLKQGSININADKVIVTRDAKTGAIQVIEGFGNLATFSQLTDDGKTLYGEAKNLYYSLKDDQLTMTEQAMLSQDDSEIRGTTINYRISLQKLVADGNSKERVSTVLQPQQVQEK